MVTSTPSVADESGKVVLITGVSKGLGRALAIEFAKRGYTVAGCSRSAEKFLELEKLLIEHGDGSLSKQHLLKQVDVSSDGSVEGFCKLVTETVGVPNIIVNNAGIINRTGKIWELSASEFDAVIDINVKGTANVIRHFLPLMKQGTIVNFSSVWGRVGDADFAPYCTSKFGVEGLTKAVANCVPEGVTVVAAHPGVIYTDMLVSSFGADRASLYPTADQWAPVAADFILALSPNDNGASLTIS